MAKNKIKLNNSLQSEELVLEKEKIKAPQVYTIVFHNDDFTTQEFVIFVLTNFFTINQEDAHNLMLKVHLEGKTKVGRFSKDIAESKVSKITSFCRANEMPLLVSAELF